MALAIGLVGVALAAPALGQADPGASSTTAVDPATTTTSVLDGSSTTTAGTTESTEPVDDASTTVPPPAAVDTPFPVALVAPVPPVAGDPDTAITDVYVTDGAEPDQPDVVVQFREPFTFALTQYQVGVVIGDPSGTRLRAWLISNGPDALPYGRVERFEAGTWTDLGATTVRFENGLMVVTVPIAEAPSGGAVWVEINENGDDEPSVTTPFFSRDALFGTADAGTIPSAIFGRLFGPEGLEREVVAELPTGGVLVSVDDRVAVTYPDVPPAEVLGRPVTAAVDIVRVAPDFDDGAVITHFVRLDRTTGEVGLYDGFSPIPIDRSGDRSWLIDAPPAGEAGALVLDRPAILAALGITDDTRVGLGISREIALDDGRVITAEGVLGTDAWLDLAPASALPEVTTTVAAAAAPGDDTAAEETRLPLLIGAAVALVVLLLLVVLLRRTRRRSETGPDLFAEPAKVDRMPWGSTDGGLIITTTHEFDALIPVDATPLPAPKPVDPTPVVPTAPAGSGVRILGAVAAPVAAPSTEPEPLSAPDAVGEPAPEPAPPARPAPAPSAPAGGSPPAPAASPLDAEPAWGSSGPEPTAGPPPGAPAPAAEAPAAPTSASAAALADPQAGPDGDADDGDGDGDDDPDGDGGLAPGRVDPLAALSALDDDMAELRRRVAALGDSPPG